MAGSVVMSNAVSPILSLTRGSAPALSKAVTISLCPLNAARCSAVRPWGVDPIARYKEVARGSITSQGG